MSPRVIVFGENTYRVSSESMYLWMSTTRLEQTTNTIFEWFQEQTMGWMLAHAPMHCYGDVIMCRVTTGIASLNERLEYAIDGFDLELEAESKQIHISFYLA